MPFNRILILLLCLSFLSACITTQNTNKGKNNQVNHNSVSFSPIAHAESAELLEFFVHYSTLQASLQKKVYQETLQALSNKQNDSKLLIKKAAMLSLPDSEMRDIPQAKVILHALLNQHQLNSTNTNLVKLLQLYAQQSIELAEKVDDLTKKNTLLKQKNKALEQKLNDIKNIEKTMIERNVETITTP